MGDGWHYVLIAAFAFVQILEARNARRAARRPYISVDFDVSDPPMIWVTIHNFGETAAMNVRFTCDPPMVSTIGRDLSGPLDKEWPYIPPRKAIRWLFDTAVVRLGDPALPTRFDVAAFYADARTGEKYGPEKYPLDLEVYRNRLYTRKKTLDELVKAVEDLTRQFSGEGLHVIAQDYGEWRDDRERWIEEAHSRLAGPPMTVEPPPAEPTEPVTTPTRRKPTTPRKSRSKPTKSPPTRQPDNGD